MCDAERARECFSYDHETGALVWRATAKNKRGWLGMPAGTVDSTGYLYVRFNGKRYPAHRVIWLMETGAWPRGQIDHIDGNKTRNAFTNLRDVDPHTNAANKHRARVDSTTGRIGVEQRGKRWVAYIYSHGKKHSLGGFPTAEQASAARAAAKPIYHKEHCHV